MEKDAWILDNGAYTIKVGYSEWEEPRIVPNCIMKVKAERRRQFIGDQIKECRDPSGLFYILPFQKGLMNSWDVQKTIWDYIFSDNCCSINLEEIPLIITEPVGNWAGIREPMEEIFFEEFNCQALSVLNASDLAEYSYRTMNQLRSNSCCVLVVDCGYSFTNIIPYIKGKKYYPVITRIDVGGKLLTNYLKDIVSYRQLNVMEETFVVNQVKEDACFVSLDFVEDLKLAKLKYPSNKIIRDYVLPDFTTLYHGYMRTMDDQTLIDQQKLRMNNERFSVPELLFRPNLIKIEQMGLSETIIHVIDQCPPITQRHFYENILIIGGSAKFSGMKERLYKDIKQLAPDVFEPRITIPENPSTYAWFGASQFCKSDDFSNILITKEQFEEGISDYEIIDSS